MKQLICILHFDPNSGLIYHYNTKWSRISPDSLGGAERRPGYHQMISYKSDRDTDCMFIENLPNLAVYFVCVAFILILLANTL